MTKIRGELVEVVRRAGVDLAEDCTEMRLLWGRLDEVAGMILGIAVRQAATKAEKSEVQKAAKEGFNG